MARIETSLFTRSGFLPSRRRTCPVCGKTDRYHCSVTKDGAIALCKYVWSDRQARDGRHIHVLREHGLSKGPLANKNAPEVKSARQSTDPRANVDRRNAVYRYMLECLTLTAEHGDHLLEARCLSDTLIASRLYASTPGAAEASGLCLHLAERFNLHGLPGFYREAGCWHLNTRHGGILIPVCDAKGRVVAIQIRRDAAEPRYVWLSSSGLLEGTSSSAPIHFAQPDLARVTGRAVITEGPLKADICAARLSGCVIGIPGVSAFPSDVGESLRRDLEGLREVAIAYDADKREKQEVKQAIARLSASLKEAGIRAKVWDWDISEGKGLDDYLLARGKLAI